MKTTVIKNTRDIARLKRHLRKCPRDYALFVVGISCHLRLNLLIKLKVSDVKDIRIGGKIKTGTEVITMTRAMYFALKPLIEERNSLRYIFRGKNFPNSALSFKSAANLVQSFGRWLDPETEFGTSVLRKTWAFHEIRTGNTDLKALQAVLGLKKPKDLFSYLGIDQEPQR